MRESLGPPTAVFCPETALMRTAVRRLATNLPSSDYLALSRFLSPLRSDGIGRLWLISYGDFLRRVRCRNDKIMMERSRRELICHFQDVMLFELRLSDLFLHGMSCHHGRI